jgi:phage tail tape-measure protein
MAEKHSQHEQNEQLGGMAGLGAGVLAGAAAGTAVMPVIGTFTGAMLGGLVGSEVGKTFGGVILDVFQNNPTPFDMPSQSHAPPPNASSEDVLSQLERLGQLKAQGVISEEEFKAAKARLLGL